MDPMFEKLLRSHGVVPPLSGTKLPMLTCWKPTRKNVGIEALFC